MSIGFDKNVEEKNVVEEKPFVVYSAQYEGGHPLYPQRRWVKVSLFENHLMVKEPKFKGEGIIIFYKDIKRIGNETAQWVSPERMALLGPIMGGLWQKRERLTIIEFPGEMGDIAMGFNFYGEMGEVHQIIYTKMLATRGIKK